jgi:hypothetical protein
MCASRVGVRGGAAASTRGLVCVAMGSPVSTRSARMPVIARWPRAAAGVQFNTAHPRVSPAVALQPIQIRRIHRVVEPAQPRVACAAHDCHVPYGCG